MKKTITTKYDVSEHLRTPQEMAAYLEACIEEAKGDTAFIVKALGDIAKAKGMSQVARTAGLSRESLYKALSGERSPGFDTILKVINALGLKLHAEAEKVSATNLDGKLIKEHKPLANKIIQRTAYSRR
jgi:probable addiction module antidote protein